MREDFKIIVKNREATSEEIARFMLFVHYGVDVVRAMRTIFNLKKSDFNVPRKSKMYFEDSASYHKLISIELEVGGNLILTIEDTE